MKCWENLERLEACQEESSSMKLAVNDSFITGALENGQSRLKTCWAVK
jgi:hypothetical protein